MPRAVRPSGHNCAALLFVVALFAVIAYRSDRVAAQEPPAAGMQRDGLIEQVSAPPPFSLNYRSPPHRATSDAHDGSADAANYDFSDWLAAKPHNGRSLGDQ